MKMDAGQVGGGGRMTTLGLVDSPIVLAAATARPAPPWLRYWSRICGRQFMYFRSFCLILAPLLSISWHPILAWAGCQ